VKLLETVIESPPIAVVILVGHWRRRQGETRVMDLALSWPRLALVQLAIGN
jgi:hypothetical protein